MAIFTFLCQYWVRKLKTVKFRHSFRQITDNSFYKSFARFVLHKFYKKSNCKEHFIKTHSNGSIHISTVSFVEITAIIWRLFLTLKKLCNNTKSADFCTYIMNIRYHLGIFQQLQHLRLADITFLYQKVLLVNIKFEIKVWSLPILGFQCHFTMTKINQILPKKFHWRI